MSGRKTFVAGDILTASQVNEFLMDQVVQVYPSDAARGSAIPSAIEGAVSYLEDVDKLQLATGTATYVDVYPAVPLSGQILKVVSATKTNTQSTSIAAGAAADISGLSISHAMQNSSNKLLLIAHLGLVADSTNLLVGGFRFLADSTEIGIGNAASDRIRVSTGMQGSPSSSASVTKNLSMTFLYDPASTSSITYKVQVVNVSGSTTTHYVNRGVSDNDSNGWARAISSLTLMEVVA